MEGLLPHHSILAGWGDEFDIPPTCNKNSRNRGSCWTGYWSWQLSYIAWFVYMLLCRLYLIKAKGWLTIENIHSLWPHSQPGRDCIDPWPFLAIQFIVVSGASAHSRISAHACIPFQGINVAASIQTYGILILEKKSLKICSLIPAPYAMW